MTRDETEVNHEQFGVFSDDDALARCSLKGLHIFESQQREYPASHCGLLKFDNAWNSHLATLVMKNGAVVGWGDSGLYIGRYE